MLPTICWQLYVEAGVDTHVVHLGTMGVYGYGAAGMTIPEGYLPIKLKDRAAVEIAKKYFSRPILAASTI